MSSGMLIDGWTPASRPTARRWRCRRWCLCSRNRSGSGQNQHNNRAHEVRRADEQKRRGRRQSSTVGSTAIHGKLMVRQVDFGERERRELRSRSRSKQACKERQPDGRTGPDQTRSDSTGAGRVQYYGDDQQQEEEEEQTYPAAAAALGLALPCPCPCLALPFALTSLTAGRQAQGAGFSSSRKEGATERARKAVDSSRQCRGPKSKP
ncbi:hypothetical protein AXG93_2789s1120 [Marchantia polymorpha subsp. ruderalis]|uniref:Uncharacterized protein n=1 Tax=Marchantia polymorpha subsp. ruderalis TaxID=1480154 RepID=A0A176W9V9_MARPO|nr:hypothetical protein AXG93_2789s1120 [Marchantia polymorpha subsp. ruderalis]